MIAKDLIYTSSGLYFSQITYGAFPINESILAISGSNNVLSIFFYKGATISGGSFAIGTQGYGLQTLSLATENLINKYVAPQLENNIVTDVVGND